MLYNKFLKMHIKTSMQYRFNTLFIGITQVLVNIGEVLGVWILFSQFTSVKGYGFYECLLMMGIVFTVFSFAECFARGYDEFHMLIKSGEFDRMLIRPVNIHYQILGSKIELTKLARMALGIALVIIALVNLNIDWSFLKILVLISSFICGITTITGLFIISATISIFTIEQFEFVNIFTNGAKETAYYPINIYAKWMTKIFTYVIPVACFNYLPLSYLLEIGNVPMWLCAISPLIGIVFIVPCIIIFNLCLKKYKSTGT